MHSRRNTVHERSPSELIALIQLRMLVQEAQLNQLLPASTPIELAREHCQPHITDTIERRVQSAMRELTQLRVRVVTVADADYPAALAPLGGHRPPILFYRGNYEMIHRPMVAIVGTRRSTEYGNSVAEGLANDFIRYDVGVISGLALGIDTWAHRGALEMGGRTVAVLGCGIDVFYPQRNARLQEQIAADGLLLSEFAPGTPAMPHHFLQRNRLIALLAGGVVVVEAGFKSGSRHTVQWALDYNVTVFAVPGPIGREASTGTNAMIQDGAHLCTSVRDVLEVLNWQVTPAATSPDHEPAGAPSGAAGAAIFDVLGPVAMQIDDIARACRCNTASALAVLAELELEGLVRQLPGKRFARARVLDAS